MNKLTLALSLLSVGGIAYLIWYSHRWVHLLTPDPEDDELGGVRVKPQTDGGPGIPPAPTE